MDTLCTLFSETLLKARQNDDEHTQTKAFSFIDDATAFPRFKSALLDAIASAKAEGRTPPLVFAVNARTNKVEEIAAATFAKVVRPIVWAFAALVEFQR